MLSIEQSKALNIQGYIPQKMNCLTFQQSNSLWKKQKHHAFSHIEYTIRKYAFRKIGKTLGFETTRYLSVTNGFLYYFDMESYDFIGYCSLENVYIAWFPLHNDQYLLLISNVTTASYFYFDNQQFWTQQKEFIVPYVIQMDFYNQYDVLQQLGQGSYSKVYLVKNQHNNRLYAAKMIFKSDTQNSLTKEYIAEQKHIVNLVKDSEYTYKFKQLYETRQECILLMQLVPGKDLMSIYKQKLQFTEQQLKLLFINILQGLKDCHKKKVIHRDIKPQNIIVDIDNDMQLKIIDFGLSLHEGQSIDRCDYKRCGTLGYMAPEVYTAKGDQLKTYSEKCDIFSFGIIAHMMLLGWNPLKGKTNDCTFARNRQCKIELDQQTIIEKYNEDCFIFLKNLLNDTPETRYSAEQALNSPFLILSSDKSESQWCVSTNIQKRVSQYE